MTNKKQNFKEILKKMHETGEDFKLTEDISIRHTYSEKDKAKTWEELDVKVYINDLELRRFGNDKDSCFELTQYTGSVKTLLQGIKAIIELDTLLEEHGMDLMDIDDIYQELGILESKTATTNRVKSEILDSILDRIEIKK